MAAVLHSMPSAAQTPQSPLVRGDSQCPEPMAVQAEVFRLSSPERRSELSDASVAVLDDGDSYRIQVNKGAERFEKVYSNPARECDKRVRFAAIYAVMILLPPDLGSDAESEGAELEEESPLPVTDAVRESPPETQPRTTKPPTPQANEASEQPLQEQPLPRGWSSTVTSELKFVLGQSLSSADAPRIATRGGELLLALGGEHWAGFTAVKAALPTRFHVGEVRAETSEVTLRGGVRHQRSRGAWLVSGELGMLVGRRHLIASGVSRSTPQDVWELGASVGLNVGLRWHHYSAGLVGLRASYVPKPSALFVLPRGQVSHMPHWWFEGLVGVQLAF